jgi:hypothetical protein
MRLTKKEKELQATLKNLGESLAKKAGKHTKSEIRRLHERQRYARIAHLNGTFESYIHELREKLATPCEIGVNRISPRLIPVESGSPGYSLFTAATLLWSVPVSQGFGRRIRYLVIDENNNKLIGIIGLADPVFNLKARDDWVGWSSKDRKERLVNVMDAFVLGAMPPYSIILGGKLIALLATSREVVRHFRKKYGNRVGIISKESKDSRLSLITTTSALGRSSIYNRLGIPSGIKFLSRTDTDRVRSWYTQGYGHFHVSRELFTDLVSVLSRRKHPYVTGNRFGDGPNWKIRVIRQAAKELGANEEFLCHGIQREVYVVPLAENTRSFLLGRSKNLRYQTLPVRDIVAYWQERWAGPRARRKPEWQDWRKTNLLRKLKRIHSKIIQEYE